MKHFAVLSLLAVAATIAAETADMPGYRLVWGDEFDKDGPPSADSWTFERGFRRNQEDQWYQGENAFCKDGVLVIEARKETIRNPDYNPDATGDNAWKKTREFADYTSASLITRGKREFQYGRLVVRAKIPTAHGAWPAIWTLGTAMEWPSCGEADLLEYYHILGVPHILANFCWGTEQRRKAEWDETRRPFQKFLDKDPDWAAKFHTWRMDWDENRIAIYLDDELLNDAELANTFNGSLGEHRNPFRHPHYILLNLALGGVNGGPIDDSAFPMRYEIDYVRIYEKDALADTP